MTSQFEVMADGHANSVALRLTRLARGKKQPSQDSLLLAMQGDPALRLAVERAGVRHFIRGALASYRVLMKTGGAYLAAHPEEAHEGHSFSVSQEGQREETHPEEVRS